MTRLSEHFSLEELTASDYAARHGIDNVPLPHVVQNLTRLAAALEIVRDILLDRAIIISSGYRSSLLNEAVKGSKNSAHLDGRAADFTCPGFGSPREICEAISKSEVPYDQLIHEFGSWVHIGISQEGVKPRRQLLTIDRGGTRAGL